jgi:hypothetical protein
VEASTRTGDVISSGAVRWISRLTRKSSAKRMSSRVPSAFASAIACGSVQVGEAGAQDAPGRVSSADVTVKVAAIAGAGVPAIPAQATAAASSRLFRTCATLSASGVPGQGMKSRSALV